jgi:hypothetical protein
VPAQEKDLAATIASAVEGFISGRPRRDLFGDSFGVREGMGLNEWIDHEVGEFSSRMSHFDLHGGEAAIRIERVMDSDRAMFSVLGKSGEIIYRDIWSFDGQGRIVGDGSMFEVVPKLQLARGRDARRGLALRSPRGRIVSVTPIGIAAEDCVLDVGLSSADDGFSTFSMEIQGDDLKGMWARFRIADDAGARATEKVWLRGADETGFAADMFPIVSGNEVEVAGRSPSWALNVVLADGRVACVDHPRPGIHRFGAVVSAAVLTDALDNDWTTLSH